MIETIKDKIIEYKYQLLGFFSLLVLGGIYKYYYPSLDSLVEDTPKKEKIKSNENITEIKNEITLLKKKLSLTEKQVHKYKEELSEKKKLTLYQTSQYSFDRNNTKSLTIEIDSSKTLEKYDLDEPLIIDKSSDVYLDSFVTNNVTHAASDKEIFILGIDEFNVQTSSNNKNYKNKIIIPNTQNDPSPSNLTIAHKSSKFNFVSTINPIKLSSLNISLTDNSSNLSALNNGSVWVTFVFVSKEE